MNKFLVSIMSLSIILTGCANTAETNSETITQETIESNSNVEQDSSQFIWPTATEEAANNLDAYEGHSGIDIVSGKGTDVVASADGTVLEAGFDKLGKGYYVLLDNGDGFETLYGQLEENLVVAEGDEVKQGDLLGYEGDSGNVTGEHLHFEIHKDGEIVDPLEYLK